MAQVKNLSEYITSDDFTIGKELIKQWNTITFILRDKYTLATSKITPPYAEKYKFDLEGLFKEYFKIENKFIYPHIIANGYTSSWDYHGEKLEFRLLDTNMLNIYYKIFTKNMKG